MTCRTQLSCHSTKQRNITSFMTASGVPFPASYHGLKAELERSGKIQATGCPESSSSSSSVVLKLLGCGGTCPSVSSYQEYATAMLVVLVMHSVH